MSLILDALNRSRQDADAVPGLATQHPASPRSAPRRQYRLWAALALALAVIGALIVDRLRAPPAPQVEIGAPVAELSRNIGSAVDSVTSELKARAAATEQAAVPGVPAPVAPEPAAPEPVAAAAAVAPQPQAVAAAPSQPVALPPAAPVATAPVSAAPVAATGQAPAAASVAAPAPQGVRDDAVEALYQNRDLEEALPEPASAGERAGAGEDASGSQRAADVERILREAREEMENANLEEHPVPFLADLSQRTKDAIPTLYYQRHDFSSNTAQSSVTLNGNTVKAGGSVVPGLKVEEILPDSVVLNYQGTQFRLRALNSWVNL